MPSRKMHSFSWSEATLLLGLAAAYAFAIFYHITKFPPYFFCDEVIHGVEAESLLRTGRDYHGVLLPLFPSGLGQYQLSLSIYLQIIFNFLFGMTEFAIRARSATLSIFGATAAFLIVRTLGNRKFAWPTFFLFILSPIWFLHSRTGFESFQATCFYLLFLYFYIGALKEKRRYHIAAALMAVASFYSYIPARGWIGLSLSVLTLVNLKIHLKLWRKTLASALIVVLLISPFIWNSLSNQGVMTSRLEAVGMNDFLRLSYKDQIDRVAQNYWIAVSPKFWFSWEGTNHSGPEERHTIPELAPIPEWIGVFVVLGLLLLLSKGLAPGGAQHRSILVALLLIPLSAAPFGVTTLRTLPVGAIYITTAALGLCWSLDWASKRIAPVVLQVITASVLLGLSGVFLQYVFNYAPYLYGNYEFYGTQSGAKEVFAKISQLIKSGETVFIASDAFNANEIFPPFYVPKVDRSKIRIADPKWLCNKTAPDLFEATWVIRPSFVTDLFRTECPLLVKVVDRVFDPRGNPIFYFATFSTNRDIAAWMAEQAQKKRELIKKQVTVGNIPLKIEYSQIDIGSPEELFDNNTSTLVRSAGVNPFIVNITFPPKTITRIRVGFSNNHKLKVSAELLAKGKTIESLDAIGESDGSLAEMLLLPENHAKLFDSIHLIIQATDSDRNGFVHVTGIDLEN